MTTRSFDSAPQRYARLAGILYLVIIAGGIFAELGVRARTLVAGDAAATARNVVAHETLYRAGYAAGVTILACALVVMVILYGLLRRVDPGVALLAVGFNLVSIAVEAGNLLNHYAPLVLLTGRGMTGADPATLEALAYAALRQQSAGYGLALTFFGGFCLAVGYLVYRSTFLPRVLGMMMAIAGLGYVVNGFTAFFSPALGARVFGVVALPCFAGEFALTLWLLVKGVDVRKWKAVEPAPEGAS